MYAESIVSVRPRHMRWYEVFYAALVHPSVDTFRRIVSDPKASLGRLYWWLTLFALITGLARIPAEQFDLGIAGYLIYFLIVGIFGPAFALLLLFITAAILNFIARRFGGNGTTQQLAYLLGVIYVIVGLLQLLVSLITAPFSGVNPSNSLGLVLSIVLSLVVTLYLWFLQAQAVRAEENISGAHALATVLIPPFIILIGVDLLVLLAISLGIPFVL